MADDAGLFLSSILAKLAGRDKADGEVAIGIRMAIRERAGAGAGAGKLE